MNKEILEQSFAHLPIPSFRFFEVTDSTNIQALNWIDDGAAEYSLVIAEGQTAGRGRNGRSWVTTPGSSIAISIILHPTKSETEKLGLFSFLGGISVVKALKPLYHIRAKVKWPNDVLIEDKKTAGILSEALWQGESLQGIVLGIGMNLLTPSISPLDELLFPATCIEAHTDLKVNPIKILTSLLETLINTRDTMLQPGFIHEYEKELAYLKQTISLDIGEGKTITGYLEGIDQFGNIRIRHKGEGEHIFPIGDIKLRPHK